MVQIHLTREDEKSIKVADSGSENKISGVRKACGRVFPICPHTANYGCLCDRKRRELEVCIQGEWMPLTNDEDVEEAIRYGTPLRIRFFDRVDRG